MRKPSTKTIWLAAGVSLSLHAMFFVAWFNTHEVKSGNVISESINHSIDIQLLAHTKNMPVVKNVTHQPNLVNREHAWKNSAQPLQQKPAKQQPAQQGNNTVTPPNQATGAKTEKLYTLLYTAINDHKYYPISALRMQQQGKVRISFRLFNNGNLDDVEVSQSSGYHSLDNAALLAVKSIQPFHPAAEYIASVENFQLDIIFQL